MKLNCKAMESIEKAISRAIKFRKYNALITETFDLARSQARDAIRRNLKPFAVVVKDCFLIFQNQRISNNMCFKDVIQFCGALHSDSRIKDRREWLILFVRAECNVIDTCRYFSGGCIIGKANMDEFCMGTSTSQGYFGAVKNGLSDEQRLDQDWLIPGGSSGGSAVAVQLGFAEMGLGSDTGGSTRNPAAFTDSFGFKPSYGVLSRYGLIPLVNSLDCPSIIANNVIDCNRFFSKLSAIQ
ncbi:unnamed protein product [Anisakis simplex]|uniref:Amidase domain-containing protein n=1 Tax=Anisakis simplex TaxID=6269 RepID=A0A3P6PFZ3_ANISI|nr:unnamed protein product [Anisakis simplex]